MPLWIQLTRAMLLGAIVFLTACTSRGQRPEDLPTRAVIEDLVTGIPLTQFAPPPPFDQPQTRFDRIDNGLTTLENWRYVVGLEFSGVYTGTDREVTAAARAEVMFNQLGSARRVLFQTSGTLFTGAESAYEAVRLGPDAFLVRDGACLGSAGTDAEVAADLRAGDLIGGIARAEPAGARATINGEDVYRYAFAPDALTVSAIRLGDNARLTLEASELWIAPARGAVVRFYADLAVENVALFDRAQLVTGRASLRYDLYEVGTPVNLTVPFGC